jgi:hypothetical protein
MGLWRIGYGLYGEEETWIPELKREWPQEAEMPPCDICVGRLTRRRYTFTGKDDKQTYSGYRYVITHYGREHDRFKVEIRDRRRSA